MTKEISKIIEGPVMKSMNINLEKCGRDGFDTIDKPPRTGFEINCCPDVLGNKILGADHFLLSGCSITH